jgi:predicted cupin superfamily sugar epimerase
MHCGRDDNWRYIRVKMKVKEVREVTEMSGSGAGYWLEKLGLVEHPEGGFYRVTYTAEMTLTAAGLPEGFVGTRPASTAIYFLLSSEAGLSSGPGGAWAGTTAGATAGTRKGTAAETTSGFSACHRLRSDEMWHFYAGGPLVVHVIAPDGAYTRLLLGPDIEAGQVFQAVVVAGCWFASAPLLAESFALVGCTVAPGFDFADFELARRSKLSDEFPQHAELIAEFTRG